MTEIDHNSTVKRIIGPTILLSSGNYFDFLAPGDCIFTIEDVAQGLSNICRFSGQCRTFYSVAEHSVWVSRILPPGHAFAGLMHDAAEAFIGDVTKPLKGLLPEYRVIEDRVEEAVFARFGVPNPLPPEVKHADRVMLKTEQRLLMRNFDSWAWTDRVEHADIPLAFLSPAGARSMFLDRYHELVPGSA